MKNLNANNLAVPVSEMALDAEGIKFMHDQFLTEALRSFDHLLLAVQEMGWVKADPYESEKGYNFQQNHNGFVFTLVLSMGKFVLDGGDENILDYLTSELAISKDWSNHAKACRTYMEFTGKYFTKAS